MRTVSKLLLFATATLLVVAAFSSTAFSQGMKMGFIDDEKIKLEYKEWGRAQEQWALEQKAWTDEAALKETELAEMMDEYDKQKLILSEEKKKEREATIMAKRDALDAYTRQIFSPGGTAEKKQFELIGPLLENVNRAIELVAVEENYDVVFTLQSGLGYIKDTYDITDKVLEQLEKLDL
ncbi:MAG: OmpH family outer membrane protein [bacterium]|nr:OmpH family outer membrane protein [bacterium]